MQVGTHIPLKCGKETHLDHEPLWRLNYVMLGRLLLQRGQQTIYRIMEVTKQAEMTRIRPRSSCRLNGNTR